MSFLAFLLSIAVCGSCGRELRGESTKCSHCGKVAAGQLPPSPPPVVRKEHSSPPPRDLSADLKRVKSLRENTPVLAFYYYSNAIALSYLDGKPLPPEILNERRQCLAAAQRGRIACENCDGTGKAALILRKPDGRDARGPVGKCRECGGTGSHPGLRSPSEVKALFAAAKATFEGEKLAEGYIKLGRAFVPKEMVAGMPVEKQAAVMSAFPKPCPGCGYTGREDCRTCKGRGWEKCPEPDCRNGRLEQRRKTHHGVVKATRMNDARDELCPRCHGSGHIQCKSCRGTRSQPCRKCDGAGLAAECKRCDGTGIVVCAKCKGRGDVRGKPCPECRSEGRTLCHACKGGGAK